jgi:hypothetical protein
MKSHVNDSGKQATVTNVQLEPAADELSDEQLDHVVGGTFIHVILDQLTIQSAGGAVLRGATSGAAKGIG